jgi:hypothetical protein
MKEITTLTEAAANLSSLCSRLVSLDKELVTSANLIVIQQKLHEIKEDYGEIIESIGQDENMEEKKCVEEYESRIKNLISDIETLIGLPERDRKVCILNRGDKTEIAFEGMLGFDD